MSVKDSWVLGRRHKPIWSAGLDITICDLQASGIMRLFPTPHQKGRVADARGFLSRGESRLVAATLLV